MRTQDIPRSAVAKAPVDKRVANILSTRLREFRPVGCHNLWVAGRSTGGSGGVVGQKNIARASSSPTCALEDA